MTVNTVFSHCLTGSVWTLARILWPLKLRSPYPGTRGWKGHYEAIAAFADGETIAVNTTGESESQVNIALRPHQTRVRWFMLRVRRRLRDLEPKPNTRLTSAEFGRIRLNRMPPITNDCKERVQQRFFWVLGILNRQLCLKKMLDI